MSLLARLLRKPAAVAEPAVAPISLREPVYYEAWGGFESANRALWAALWLSGTIALLLAICLRVQMTRPPVVIRVSENGEASVAKPGELSAPVGNAEVRNFLALFERFFVELNAYTYDADLRMAFAMMTPEFQAKANERLKREAVVEGLQSNETRTRVVLTDLRVERETGEFLECRLKGYREIGSFKPDTETREVVFEHEIVLRKVPRSENAPYGVLVEAFNESVFKR